MPRQFPLRPIRVPGALDVTLRLPRPRRVTAPGDNPPGSGAGGDCVVAIDGLYWADQSPVEAYTPEGGVYGDGSQIGNEDSTTAVNVTLTEFGAPDIADTYGVWAAWLRGQTCGCVPVWNVTWEDGDIPGEVQPQVHLVGGVMIVTLQSALGYGDGTLTASATCGGVTYGPITMTLAFATP